MNTVIRYTGITGLLAVFCLPVNALADVQLSIAPGIKLFPNTWSGEDEDTEETFDSSATAAGLNLKVQWRQLYGALSLSGAEYTFKDTAPARPTGSQVIIPEEGVDINRSDFDFAIGYYFLDFLSAFVDIKGTSVKWSDDYQVDYSGIGLGITAHHQFSARWGIYGSLGVVPLTIREDDEEIGSGAGSALEVGGLFRASKIFNIHLSLRSQSQRYEYDSGITEKHNVGGINLGVSAVFSM